MTKKLFILIFLLIGSLGHSQFDGNTTQAEWVTEFDRLLYNDGNLSALQDRANTDGARQQYYYMYYHLQPLWEVWRITGDLKYLDIIIDAYYDVVSSAVPVSWNSSYLGWPIDPTYSSNGDFQANGAVLYESYGFRPFISTLRLMKDSPTLLGTSNGSLPGATYQTNYDEMLAFMETHLWDKWYNKDLDEIYRVNTHMTSHWARIAMELHAITGTQQYLDVFNNISFAGFPASEPDAGANLRDLMVTQGDGAIFWDSSWFCTPCGNWQDTSHASDLYDFWLMAYDLGYHWTLTDITGFKITMDQHWFPSNIGANVLTRINGAQGIDDGKRMFGCVRYGRFDESLRTRIISQYTNDSSVKDWGNYGVNYAAYNLYNKFYVDGSTFAYPEAGGIPVTSITLVDDDQTITDSEDLDLSLTFAPTDATDQGVSYVSNNLSAVDNTGAVVGVGSGTLTVTADDTSNSANDVLTFDIIATPVTELSVTPSNYCLSAARTTVQLSVSFGDTVPTDTSGTWTSDNTGVATVNSSGLVTYVGLGSANIDFTSTSGSITDTMTITASASCGDSIEDLNLITYLSDVSVQPSVTVDGNAVNTWEDISGNNRSATASGSINLNLSTTRQSEFQGGYWYYADIPELEIQGGTDERTIITREGDVASQNSGYLFGKVSTGPFTVEYGLAYSNGDVSGLYVGGNLIGFSNVPPGPNRLFVITISTTTATVRCDGAVIGGGAVGTAQASGQRLNLGGRTDGSYLMDTGSTMDLFAMATGVASAGEITNIENEFIVNIPDPTPVKVTGFSSGSNEGSYMNINGEVIYIGN